jgi:hypothetical protein
VAEPEALLRARQRKQIVNHMRRQNASVPMPPGADRIGMPAATMGAGENGEIHWYTDRMSPGFLFRVRWEDGGLWLERYTAGEGWVETEDLLDYFTGHEQGALEITQAEAEELERVSR